jgi:hypothetical protein
VGILEANVLDRLILRSVAAVLHDRGPVTNELLVDLLVLVHRARPGDLLDLADGFVQVVLVDPGVQALDSSAKAGFENGRRAGFARVVPVGSLLVRDLPAGCFERIEGGAFGFGVLVGHGQSVVTRTLPVRRSCMIPCLRLRSFCISIETVCFRSHCLVKV